MVEYLAARCGFKCVRINNHEHTDVQEYIGGKKNKICYFYYKFLFLRNLILLPLFLFIGSYRLRDEQLWAAGVP